MNDLNEMYRVIEANAPRSGNPVAPSQSSSTMVNAILKGLSTRRWQTDEEAALELYGSEQRSGRFKTIRSRVTDKLIQAVLSLGISRPQHSEILCAWYKCLRGSTVALILARLGAREAAVKIAGNLSPICERFEFTDIHLQLALLQRDMYALWNLPIEFEREHALVQRLTDTSRAEHEADYQLDRLRLYSSTEFSNASGMDVLYTATLHTIANAAHAYATNSLQLNHLRAQILCYEYHANFAAVEGACQDALEMIKEYPHLNPNARKAEFLVCLIAARVYQRIAVDNELATECEGVIKIGGYNWYVLRYLLFVNSMLKEDYLAALEIYEDAVTRSEFESLDVTAKEKWIIARGYIVLTTQIGKIHRESVASVGFRLSTYRNSLDWEAKAKHSSNALAVVFECMYLLHSGHRTEAEKRIAYLNVYGCRYMREAQHARVRRFIKFLHGSIRLWDDKTGLERYAQVALAELEELKGAMPGDVNEIIPFHTLISSLPTPLQ